MRCRPSGKPGLSISFWNSPAAVPAIAQLQVCQATNVSRVEIIERRGECQVLLNGPAEQIDGGLRIALL
jgi:hypothetical protein